MEIALFVRSFSFYHSSQTIYIQGKVSELRNLPESKKDPNFHLITRGRQLNFKYEGEKYREILGVLLSETVIIETTQCEQIKDKFGNVSYKFVIDNFSKVQLLPKTDCTTKKRKLTTEE